MSSDSVLIIDRDIQIISMVYSYGGVSTEQVRLRFWPGSDRGVPCYRRLKQLINGGYLVSQRLPSISGVGSGKLFLSIGSAARPILAELLNLPRSELVRIRMKAPQFIGHHLSLCDLRLAIELAAENSTVFDVVDWKGERDLSQVPYVVSDPKTGNKTTVISDASFVLMLSDGTSQKFVVEMDMGTIPKRLKAKLRAYLNKPGDQTPILFVVPDVNRQKSIAIWALEEAEGLEANPNIFWIASKAAASKNSVLSAPIWEVVGRPQALALESLVLGEPKPTRQEFIFDGGLS